MNKLLEAITRIYEEACKSLGLQPLRVETCPERFTFPRLNIVEGAVCIPETLLTNLEEELEMLCLQYCRGNLRVVGKFIDFICKVVSIVVQLLFYTKLVATCGSELRQLVEKSREVLKMVESGRLRSYSQFSNLYSKVLLIEKVCNRVGSAVFHTLSTILKLADVGGVILDLCIAKNFELFVKNCVAWCRLAFGDVERFVYDVCNKLSS